MEKTLTKNLGALMLQRLSLWDHEGTLLGTQLAGRRTLGGTPARDRKHAHIPVFGLPAPVGLAAPLRAKAPISTVPTPRRLPVDISDLQGDKTSYQQISFSTGRVILLTPVVTVRLSEVPDMGNLMTAGQNLVTLFYGKKEDFC